MEERRLAIDICVDGCIRLRTKVKRRLEPGIKNIYMSKPKIQIKISIIADSDECFEPYIDV